MAIVNPIGAHEKATINFQRKSSHRYSFQTFDLRSSSIEHSHTIIEFSSYLIQMQKTIIPKVLKNFPKLKTDLNCQGTHFLSSPFFFSFSSFPSSSFSYFPPSPTSHTAPLLNRSVFAVPTASVVSTIATASIVSTASAIVYVGPLKVNADPLKVNVDPLKVNATAPSHLDLEAIKDISDIAFAIASLDFIVVEPL